MARSSAYLAKTNPPTVRWYAPTETGGFRHMALAFEKPKPAQQFLARLSLALDGKAMPRQDVFGVLEHAIRTHRPIVPLIGAGLAGNHVPTLDSLAHYFRLLQTEIQEMTPMQPAWRWLHQHGWPDARALYARRHDRKADVSGSEPFRDWREGFYSLTASGGAPEWVTAQLGDWFRRDVMREEVPSSAHYLLAYLARAALNVPLILNAASDDRVLRALRDTGQQPIVLDFNANGLLPDPEERNITSASDRTKLVNLYPQHGAQPFLFEPHPLPSAALTTFRRYLGQDALILVLGEEGHDRRIGQCAYEATQLRSRGSSELNVLWMFRGDAPAPQARALAATGSAAFGRYTDEALFLLELICRTQSAFPPALQPYYEAMSTLAPLIDLKEQEAGDSDERQADGPKLFQSLDEVERTESIVVVSDEDSAFASQLASFTEILRRTHTVILVDCEESNTVDGLIQRLFSQFLRYDPDLPPLVMSELGQPLHSGLIRGGLEAKLERLVALLRRKKYALVFDAVGMFATTHLEFSGGATASNAGWNELQRREDEDLLTFLRLLVERAGDFGSSKLFISSTRIRSKSEKSTSEKDPRAETLLGSLGAILESSPHVHRLFPGQLPPDQLLREFTTTKPKKQTVDDFLTRKFDSLPAETQIAMITASSFRKPRSIVLLRKCMAALEMLRRDRKNAATKKETPHPQAQLNELLKSGTYESLEAKLHEFDETYSTLPDAFDDCFRQLESAGFGALQDGGFLWLRRRVRNWVYEKFVRNSDADAAANLHDLIAGTFWDDAFVQSHDPAVFIEYIAHRLLSARHPNPAKALSRLRTLVACLRQQRAALSSGDYAATALRWILRMKLVDLPLIESKWDQPPTEDQASEFRKIKIAVCDLEAELRRALTDFDGCLELRREQINDRLGQLAQLQLHGPATAKTSIAELATAILRSDLPQAAAALAPGPRRERALDLMRRLISHVHSVGLCLTGLRRHVEAESVLFETAQCLDKSLNDGPPGGVTEGWRMFALRTAADCRLHLMLIKLDRIPLWGGHDLARCKKMSPKLKKAEAYYAAGQTTLRKLFEASSSAGDGPEQGAESYYSYKGRFATLRCRLSALKANNGVAYKEDEEAGLAENGRLKLEGKRREFDIARKYCDLAQAVISERRGGDTSFAAVCHLTEAELLILQLDFEAGEELDRADRGAAAAAIVGPGLQSALGVLDRAAGLLRRGPQSVRWWTWLSTLQAQVKHDLFAWSLVSNDDPAVEAWRDSLIAEGLRAIGIGLDNVAKDDVRRNSLLTLYWQFYICHLLSHRHQQRRKRNSPAEGWGPAFEAADLLVNWRDLLNEASLSWYDAALCNRHASGDSPKTVEHRERFAVEIERLREQITEFVAIAWRQQEPNKPKTRRAQLLEIEKEVFRAFHNRFYPE